MLIRCLQYMVVGLTPVWRSRQEDQQGQQKKCVLATLKIKNQYPYIFIHFNEIFSLLYLAVRWLYLTVHCSLVSLSPKSSDSFHKNSHFPPKNTIKTSKSNNKLFCILQGKMTVFVKNSGGFEESIDPYKCFSFLSNGLQGKVVKVFLI